MVAPGLTLLLQASATDAPGDAATFYSYLRGERWSFVVTREARRYAPSWDPAIEDAPPLLPGQALSVAREKLSEWLRDGARWQLIQIVLCPVLEDWVYVVEFGAPLPGPVTSLSVVVLMDGTGVAPQREPWPSG